MPILQPILLVLLLHASMSRLLTQLFRSATLAPIRWLLASGMGNLFCLNSALNDASFSTSSPGSLEGSNRNSWTLQSGGTRPALLWTPRARVSKDRERQDRASATGTGTDSPDGSSVAPSLLEISAQIVARAYDRIPPEQLSQLPGDLMQQVINQLLTSATLSPLHLRLLPSPADLDTLHLEGRCTLTPVSDELVVEIGRSARMRDLDLSRCTLVTDKGIKAIGSGCKDLIHLRLNYCIQISDAALHQLSDLTNLQTLELGGCENLSSEGLSHLTPLSLLTSLVLNQCGRVRGGLQGLALRLSRLSRLDLGWCTALGDAQLSCLYRLAPSLTHLDLSATRVSDVGVSELSALSCLQQLGLKGCDISSVAAAVIGSNFTALTTLELDRCGGIGDQAMVHLAKLSSLQRLGLGNTSLSDTGLLKLAPLTTLTHLDLESCHVGDDGCKVLLHLPLLQHLNLADTHIQDPTLALLERQELEEAAAAAAAAALALKPPGQRRSTLFPHLSRRLELMSPGRRQGLRWMNLSYTQVTNAGVAHLKTLTSLTHLNLDSASLHDAAVLHLTALSRLTALEAFSLRLHDSGAAAVARLPSLRRLELCGGSLTDTSCSHLSRLSFLTSLSLAHNPRITDLGVSLLCPGLTLMEELNLSGTAVSGRCAAGLAQLGELRLLSLCNTRVTDSGAAALKLALPSTCTLKHSHHVKQ